VPKGHVFREFFLRDTLFYFEFTIFYAADIAVDDTGVIFLTDNLIALRMANRAGRLAVD
jgi:hypothetical protein